MAAARPLVPDVVAGERPPGAPSSLLTRVRCSSCAMPGRRREDTCWSCGLDPTRPGGSDERQSSEPGPSGPEGSRRRARVVGGMLLVMAAVLVSLTFVAQTDRGQGVHGIAVRVRGGAWERASVSGASAEFPTRPVHRSVPSRLGLPQGGETLVATARGVRAELLVAPVAEPGTMVDRPAVADELVSGYAVAAGGRVVTRTPRDVGGSPGQDAVVEGPDGTVHVQAVVIGTRAHLLAMTGPTSAAQRFTGSFRTQP